MGLRERLIAAGARPQHLQHLQRLWAQALPLHGGRRRPEDFLPARVRALLPHLEAELAALAMLHERHPDADGSERLLVRLHDGQVVESVLLPRGGVCVSTQLGCAVGCVFCMTGRSGLLRQLSGAEIVAQVVLARRLRPVRKVVLMGMGEPSHNLEQVLEAIELLGTAGGIGHKNLVFSTVGDERAFERLLALPVGRVRPALALSLHSSDDELRRRLLPRAPRVGVDELARSAESYARSTGYPTQYQWTLLDGVNDGDAEIEGIERLLAGRLAIMNLIPYNAVESLPYRRPPSERCEQMAAELRRRGIIATLRQSAAQGVDGGCGQLRARDLTGRSIDAAIHPMQRWPIAPVPAAAAKLAS